MRKLAALMLPLFSCAPAAIDSVDGLGGGELSSALSAPKLTADAIEATTATMEDVSASSVDADSVTTRSVDADVLTAGTIRHRGFVLSGAPVGTVQFGELAEPAGYRSADDSCRAEFGSDAHVCAADEAMLAWRSGVDINETWSGAAVNTFGFYASLQVDIGSFSVVIDDCDAWSDRSTFPGYRLIQDEGAVARSTVFTPSYMSFYFDETSGWRMKPGVLLSTEPSCESVQLLCCG